jgi:glucose/arabinose dehydrogenase
LLAGADAPILQPIATGLNSPVYVAHAGDGSGAIYILEQAGRILRMAPDAAEPALFLDIQDRVVSGGEMGLLSVAFHPRFAENGRFFVNYTTKKDNQLWTIVSEYRLQGGVAGREERTIIAIQQPFSNHNGGQLQFGPDGYLYIGMGDGGAAGDPFGHGQNLDTLLGKMLRLDVDNAAEGSAYAAPKDNPFVAKDGADEIWAYGLRNPWRFSFDRASGRLFTADVGQNHLEEVDIIVRGGNYGWNVLEASRCFPPTKLSCRRDGMVMPIAEYGRSEGISVTGGYVYRGAALPALNGAYVFGDFGSGAIWTLREGPEGEWARDLLLESPQPISSFGEDEAGEIYVVGYEGTVFRLAPAAPLPPPPAPPPAPDAPPAP